METQGCTCCGELITLKSSDYSRHVRLCAGCSSLVDGMIVLDRSELDQSFLSREASFLPRDNAESLQAV